VHWSGIFDNTLSAFFGVNAMYFAIAALGLNVQFGYTGLLNFGQAAFMACGAYGLGMTSQYFGISFWWGLPLGIGFAVVLGLIMGIPTLRLRSDYLAIVTIAVAEVVRLVVRSVRFQPFFGASDGINQFSVKYRALNPYLSSGKYPIAPWRASGVPEVLLFASFVAVAVVLGLVTWNKLGNRLSSVPRMVGVVGSCVLMFAVLMLAVAHVEYTGYSLYTLTVGWVLAAIFAVFVYLLMRSPWGRVLKAIREDEDAVRSLGKNVYSYKMQALILGGVIATFAGMMLALDRGSVQPDNYSRDVTFYVLTALVLGGAAKVSGSIIGPMIYWAILGFADSFLNEVVRTHNGHYEIFGLHVIGSLSQIGQIQLMLVGLMLVSLMVFRPQGIFGNRKEMALDGR
jgi:branched-chain amino acid transport system permease protein